MPEQKLNEQTHFDESKLFPAIEYCDMNGRPYVEVCVAPDKTSVPKDGMPNSVTETGLKTSRTHSTSHLSSYHFTTLLFLEQYPKLTQPCLPFEPIFGLSHLTAIYTTAPFPADGEPLVQAILPPFLEELCLLFRRFNHLSLVPSKTSDKFAADELLQGQLGGLYHRKRKKNLGGNPTQKSCSVGRKIFKLIVDGFGRHHIHSLYPGLSQPPPQYCSTSQRYYLSTLSPLWNVRPNGAHFDMIYCHERYSDDLAADGQHDPSAGCTPFPAWLQIEL